MITFYVIFSSLMSAVLVALPCPFPLLFRPIVRPYRKSHLFLITSLRQHIKVHKIYIYVGVSVSTR